MGQAQNCGCCSGYGSKVVVQEPLLADAPSPRLDVRLDSSCAKVPIVVSLSERLHLEQSESGDGSGGTGGTGEDVLEKESGSKSGVGGGAGGSNSLFSKASGAVRAGLKDGSLERLCRQASPENELQESAELHGLRGLEWAKAFAATTAKSHDSFGETAAQELQSKPFRACQELPSSAHESQLSGLEFARTFGGNHEVAAEDEDLAAELVTSSQAMRDGGGGEHPRQKKPGLKLVKSTSPIEGKKLRHDASSMVQVGSLDHLHEPWDAFPPQLEEDKAPASKCCLGLLSRKVVLSRAAEEELEDLFEYMMLCNSRVSREDVRKLLEDTFGDVATQVCGNAPPGNMALPEFVELWRRVKSSGVKESDLRRGIRDAKAAFESERSQSK